jgi:D-amino-acid dehydrogenase
MKPDAPDVLIIGGGAVGVACAYELAKRGVPTTLLEREAALGLGCSYGSAGLISPSHATPLANPAALRNGLRWMLEPSGPFWLNPRPGLLPWLARFALASTPGRVRKSTRLLRGLAARSLELHRQYFDAELDTGFRHNGSVSLFETVAAFEKAQHEARLQVATLPPVTLLDDTALRDLGISPTGSVVGAMHFAADAHCDSHQFVTSTGAGAERAGSTIVTGVSVHSLHTAGSRITRVETSRGIYHPGEVILAAGVWAEALAHQIGLFLPVQGGKGFHIDLSARSSDPDLPVYMQESLVIATPLAGRLRLAGMLGLTGLDTTIDHRRLAVVRHEAERYLGGLAGRRALATWSGIRSCTPDGLPVIGRPPSVENLVLAVGHAMKGVALAPITGQVVADMILRQEGTVEVSSLRPDRFRALGIGVR